MKTSYIVYDNNPFLYDETNILDEINLYFNYKDSVVLTSYNDFFKKRVIRIIGKGETEEFEGASEVPKYYRAELLEILDIISFLLNTPFAAEDNAYASYITDPFMLDFEKTENDFTVNDKDYTESLNKLLEQLKTGSKFELITEILDRWRKSLNLFEQRGGVDNDEAVLNLFQILNSLCDTITKKELIENLEKDISSLEKINISPEQEFLDNLHKQKRLSFGNKIKGLLYYYDLLDDKSYYFVEQIIKKRNLVSHGSTHPQKNSMWPLTPFFNLVQDDYDDLAYLQLLVKTLISCYLEIDLSKDDWNDVKDTLLPSWTTMENFLNNPVSFADVVNEEKLMSGNKFNITWDTIFMHYVLCKDQKKGELYKQIEQAVKEFFLNSELRGEEATSLFNISVLLCDSKVIDIKRKATENVLSMLKNGWYEWSDPREIYSYLKYYNIEPYQYKEFLNNGEHL